MRIDRWIRNILGKKLTLSTIIFIISIIIIYVLYKLYFINTRDKINFNKTYIPFDDEEKKSIVKINKNKKESSLNIDLGCVGSDCCDLENMEWDEANNKCRFLA